jgi:hypothetical protein
MQFQLLVLSLSILLSTVQFSLRKDLLHVEATQDLNIGRSEATGKLFSILRIWMAKWPSYFVQDMLIE